MNRSVFLPVLDIVVRCSLPGLSFLNKVDQGHRSYTEDKDKVPRCMNEDSE